MLKLSNKQDIGAQLDHAHKMEQKARREALIKQLSSLRYLLRQELAVRGHEASESNLIQLLQLRSGDDPQLKKWINDQKYCSPDILNEQIEIMANSVLSSILVEIQSAAFFSILADEATDVNRCGQMCVCIRWVNDEYEVSEDLIGLMQVPQTDSSTLFGALRDVCIRCMLPFVKCRGQAYDGAANMSGHLNGVAACVKHEQSAALHVHCLAHSLNLCLQDVARVCETIREGLHLVMELVQLIKWSPKRSSLFEKLQGEMSPGAHDLRALCPTRWTVRTGAIHAVIENYATLCHALDEIHASGRDEYAMKAGGCLQQMEKFRTFFGLKLGYLVFSITEQLSVTLQRKDTTVQEANEAALLSGRYLSQLRNEEEYGRF